MLACNFGRFFNKKIKNIIKAISGIIADEKFEEVINYENNENGIPSMNAFKILSEDNVKTIIMSMSFKYCELDTLP